MTQLKVDPDPACGRIESFESFTGHTGLLSVGAKWNHMMSPAPGPGGSQFRQYDMPPLSDFNGDGPPALVLAAEGLTWRTGPISRNSASVSSLRKRGFHLNHLLAMVFVAHINCLEPDVDSRIAQRLWRTLAVELHEHFLKIRNHRIARQQGDAQRRRGVRTRRSAHHRSGHVVEYADNHGGGCMMFSFFLQRKDP